MTKIHQTQLSKDKIDYSKYQIQLQECQTLSQLLTYVTANTTFKLQIPQERARLLGLSQRALNEGKTNAVVFVTGDQVSPHNHDDVFLPSQQN